MTTGRGSTAGARYELLPQGSEYRLVARERPPAPAGVEEVRVRVEAASLNYRDLLVRSGQAGPSRAGLVPLSDGAGRVIEVGPRVTRWKVGDRVATLFFPAWRGGPFQRTHAALGGGEVDGVLAREITAREDALVRLPDHLTFEEGAALPCAGVTAWNALFTRGRLAAGETVLVQGTGGVALFGLQLAAAAGARVIVTSSSDEKLERARALGAWKTINYRAAPAWDDEARRLTGGDGVDHLLELGGPETYARSIAALAPGGRIAQIGVLTGFGSQPNLWPLQAVNGSIHGIFVGSGEHFEALNGFLAEKQLRPVIDRVFPFEEADAAYRRLESGTHFGKVVIRV